MSNYKVEQRAKRPQISASDWYGWSDWYLAFEFSEMEAASSYIKTQQNSDLNSSVEREYRIVMLDGSIFTPKPLKKSAEEKIRAIVSDGDRSCMLDLTFVEMQEIVAALDESRKALKVFNAMEKKRDELEADVEELERKIQSAANSENWYAVKYFTAAREGKVRRALELKVHLSVGSDD